MRNRENAAHKISNKKLNSLTRINRNLKKKIKSAPEFFAFEDLDQYFLPKNGRKLLVSY